jgi:hypothetical protein
MKETLILEDKNRASSEFNNSLEEVLGEGARRLLSQAIENEVKEYFDCLTLVHILPSLENKKRRRLILFR